MPSSFSSSLRLELPATGEQSGAWGTTLNRNLGTLLEQAIAGVNNVSIPNSDYTLTAANGVADESRNAVINLTSSTTLTATRNVVIPNAKKVYTVRNSTSGTQSVVVKTATGTGITIPQGWLCTFSCDGSNNLVQLAPFYSPATGTTGGIFAGTNGSFTGPVVISNTGSLSVSGITTMLAPRNVGTGRPIVASDNTFGPWSWNGGGQYLQLDVAGTIYGISAFVSDVSRKNNIAPAQDPVLPLFRQIDFIDFEYKPGPGQVEADMPRQHGGVSAQQLQQLRAEWVNALPDGSLFPNLLTMLTNTMKAVQELDARLTALEGGGGAG